MANNSTNRIVNCYKSKLQKFLYDYIELKPFQIHKQFHGRRTSKNNDTLILHTYLHVYNEMIYIICVNM